MFYINKDAHLKITSATLPGCFFPNCCTAVVKIPLTFLTSTVSFDNSSSTIHAWSLSESGGDQFSFWYSFLASGNPKIKVMVNLVFFEILGTTTNKMEALQIFFGHWVSPKLHLNLEKLQTGALSLKCFCADISIEHKCKKLLDF